MPSGGKSSQQEPFIREDKLTALYLPSKFNDLQGYDTAHSQPVGGKSLIH